MEIYKITLSKPQKTIEKFPLITITITISKFLNPNLTKPVKTKPNNILSSTFQKIKTKTSTKPKTFKTKWDKSQRKTIVTIIIILKIKIKIKIIYKPTLTPSKNPPKLTK